MRLDPQSKRLRQSASISGRLNSGRFKNHPPPGLDSGRQTLLLDFTPEPSKREAQILEAVKLGADDRLNAACHRYAPRLRFAKPRRAETIIA